MPTGATEVMWYQCVGDDKGSPLMSSWNAPTTFTLDLSIITGGLHRFLHFLKRFSWTCQCEGASDGPDSPHTGLQNTILNPNQASARQPVSRDSEAPFIRATDNNSAQGDLTLQDCNHGHSRDKQNHRYVNRSSDSRVVPDVRLRPVVLSWDHLMLQRAAL